MFEKKKYSYKVLLSKMMRYCAMEEKCEFDVKQKLYNLNADKSEIDKIIDYLNEENFISEERYVAAFIKGKMNSRKWGKLKIANALAQKQIDSKIVAQYFEENVREENYKNNLDNILLKKLEELKRKDLEPQKIKEKLFYYASSKGYEKNLIFDFFNKYL